MIKAKKINPTTFYRFIGKFQLKTLEGYQEFDGELDLIAVGVDKEIYPIKKTIFAKTYEIEWANEDVEDLVKLSKSIDSDTFRKEAE